MFRKAVLIGLCGAAAGCVYDWSIPVADTDVGESGDTGPMPATSTGLVSGSGGTSTSTSGGSTSGSSSGSSSTGETPSVQPGRWIHSAAILSDGDASSTADEASRFDLLIASPSAENHWGDGQNNSWSRLVGINPQQTILLEFRGPGVYRTNEGLGEGWNVIASQYGVDDDPRFVAIGTDTGRTLQVSNNPFDRAMWMGAPGWPEYYTDALYDRIETQAVDGRQSVAGAFLLFTEYRIHARNDWEADVDGMLVPDTIADYASNLEWREDLDAYLDYAIPNLAARPSPMILALDFEGLAGDDWATLDSREIPATIAVSDTGLISPAGGVVTVEYFVAEVEAKLDTLANIGSTGLVHVNAGGGTVDIGGTGLSRMASPESTNTSGSNSTELTGWQAMWFAMCAHMAVIDTTRDDIYFSFDVWDHRDIFWFDEFDPAFIHLGDAIGGRFGPDGSLMREFEDGWVVANPTNGGLNLVVPDGQLARVIDHDNFLNPDGEPLVAGFELGVHQGVILLKDGAILGNALPQ